MAFKNILVMKRNDERFFQNKDYFKILIIFFERLFIYIWLLHLSLRRLLESPASSLDGCSRLKMRFQPLLWFSTFSWNNLTCPWNRHVPVFIRTRFIEMPFGVSRIIPTDPIGNQTTDGDNLLVHLLASLGIAASTSARQSGDENNRPLVF